jgi:carbamoyltransferase
MCHTSRMLHLGIAYGHNATVAVIEDGRVVFCQSEERLNRIKNAMGIPRRTLDHVYRMIGGPERVASCALFLGFAESYLMRDTYAASGEVRLANPLRFDRVDGWLHNLPAAIATQLAQRAAHEQALADPVNRTAGRAHFATQLGLPPDKLVEVPHHETHACSVIPFLPADHAGPVLIFTLDGEGDGLAASVSRFERGRFTTLSTAPRLCSLGRIYGYVTNILGFQMLEHEYKIMGLAPYAKAEYAAAVAAELRKLLWVDEAGEWCAGYRINADLGAALHALCTYQRFDTVAGALQAYTEEMVTRWIAHWVGTTGIGTIACAGGVFMNVKANQRVAALRGVTRLIVTPSCADESCALGAAVYASRAAEPATPIARLDHVYLGTCIDGADVARLLRDQNLQNEFAITEPPDIDRAVAELLAHGQVVGRCAGAMEFGARALGNRSILAHPGELATVEHINRAIKSRDFWMPFAPSILAEAIEDLIEDPKGAVSPFMMVSADTTARGRAVLAAAIHRADGTVRPQRVERAANPRYHALIAHFRALTGIGAVLNTSFNLHGDPIVCSPEDAIDTVRRSGLRWLALDHFLLEKRAGAGLVGAPGAPPLPR